LRSRTTGQYYTGSTSDLPRRFEQHIMDESIPTKHRGPWELIHHEEYASRAEAMHRERYFKTGKGARRTEKAHAFRFCP
jgi:putative endonuclease